MLAVASPIDADATDAIALLTERPQVGEKATAYVCQRFVCRLPVTEPSALSSALDNLP